VGLAARPPNKGMKLGAELIERWQLMPNVGPTAV
jgi:hypothetical protein